MLLENNNVDDHLEDMKLEFALYSNVRANGFDEVNYTDWVNFCTKG